MPWASSDGGGHWPTIGCTVIASYRLGCSSKAVARVLRRLLQSVDFWASAKVPLNPCEVQRWPLDQTDVEPTHGCASNCVSLLITWIDDVYQLGGRRPTWHAIARPHMSALVGPCILGGLLVCPTCTFSMFFLHSNKTLVQVEFHYWQTKFLSSMLIFLWNVCIIDG